MPRLTRVAPAGVAQHIIQRGNNRQVCFASEQDLTNYMGWFKEYSDKYSVDVHAWVLMTNHVHMLCTPRLDTGISQMMQSIGRMYVRYFNVTYGRSGTLWEGRYKASLIDSEPYLLEVYRYIELNPVRANMVADPSDYKWSSYRCNALGQASKLCTPHKLYLQLGENALQRQINYRRLFKTQVSKQLICRLRRCANSGLAVGPDGFVEQIEALAKARVSRARMGRPLKDKI